jgi:dihydropteroate synthase
VARPTCFGPRASQVISGEDRVWRLRGEELRFPPSRAVGIVNVTDDSFFAGARSGTPDRAVADGLALAADGFDLLDVGAVAARSGPPVRPADEIERLIPTIERLADSADVPIIADTYSPDVARAALEAGAVAINDISGGADTTMLELVAESGCGYVLMHIEGPPRVDREPPPRGDSVADVRAWHERRIEAAAAIGVAVEQIAIDPGLDFDLAVDDDLAILRRLGELRSLGRPVYLALSRKDFLGAVLAGSWEQRAPAERREWATVAATALAVAGGAELLRLHDRSALDALRVAEAIARPERVEVGQR